MWETQDRSLDCEDPLEKRMTTHSRILAWRIPRKEEPGGLQSMRPQRVKQDPFPFACIILGFSSGSTVKESTCSAGMQIRSLGQEDSLEEEIGTHSSILLISVRFPESSAGKESTCNAGDLGSIPGWEDPLEEGKATHSSVVPWRILWWNLIFFSFITYSFCLIPRKS